MRLHLGCGTNYLHGWINIDLYPTSERGNTVCEADVFHDICKLDECYQENTIDEIYLCHVFEHLDKKEATIALSCWYKILKPGGILTIYVPDANKIMKGCLGLYTMEEAQIPPPPGANPMQIDWTHPPVRLCKDDDTSKEEWFFYLEGTHEYDGEIHKCHYTPHRMSILLEKNGFKDITEIVGVMPFRDFGMRGIK